MCETDGVRCFTVGRKMEIVHVAGEFSHYPTLALKIGTILTLFSGQIWEFSRV